MRDLREGCATVAARAAHIAIEESAIPGYGSSLQFEPPSHPTAPPTGQARERLAAYWLTLDAINFGSGWFPTLRKRPGRSGYFTIAEGLRERFAVDGAWDPRRLAQIQPTEIAGVLGQDPAHELMRLFAASLRDLGTRVSERYDSRFAAAVDVAGGSAVALARQLGEWDCFADTSNYEGISLPFLKRAQIAGADLARSGVSAFRDLDQLTAFADNLVPHVLRLDGILRYEPGLVRRIERGELIRHGSPEEVEIRACALHAVELIVAATGRPAMEVDQLLWNRGQQPRYKRVPRHRSRCTAY